jgi:F0F1-type ATP synthase membrane subunit b/b'
MIFSSSFVVTGGSLFDFDFTFVTEAILFILLAVVVTFTFLGPISKQLEERAEYVNIASRKATFFVGANYQESLTSLSLVLSEIEELNRQLKLTKEYTQIEFEKEISLVKTFTKKFLQKVQSNLSLQSASFLITFNPKAQVLGASYFRKRF